MKPNADVPMTHLQPAPTPVFLPRGSGRAQAAGWKTQKEGANTSKYNS